MQALKLHVASIEPCLVRLTPKDTTSTVHPINNRGHFIAFIEVAYNCFSGGLGGWSFDRYGATEIAAAEATRITVGDPDCE